MALQIPMFHTHHAPVGAWASLTFGSPSKGVSIDLENPEVKDSGTLLFGMANGQEVHTIGFTERQKTEGDATGDRERPPMKGAFRDYGLYGQEEIVRTLTPSLDRYEAGNLCLTVYTPCQGLPDPEKGEIPSDMCLPGVLMDLTVDNRTGERPCTAFFGLAYPAPKKIAAVDTANMCGFGYKGSRAFAAEKEEDIFLVQGGGALGHLKEGKASIHQNGPAFIGLHVPAGEKRTLSVVWAVYASEGSNGYLHTRYYYSRYFGDVFEATEGVLARREQIRQRSEEADRALMDRVDNQDASHLQLFCQAVRGYYASSQLLEDAEGQVHWNVSEGAYLWRNTMDLCADHLAWELLANPWIVRSLMDDFLEGYSYHDRVNFVGWEGDFPGGISFCHDMGCFFTYSGKGHSAYEHENAAGQSFYLYMTTEELLNGIYGICGYVLKTGDMEWLKSHEGLLSELMDSLENRDASTEDERNGILKAVSCRSGTCGLESTTYDALDHSLLEASGNLYVFIKTWCALVMLCKCALAEGNEKVADRAERMLQRCRNSVRLFQDSDNAWLKANAYRDLPGAVAAAAEALVIPYLLGVLRKEEEPELFDGLYRHEMACLRPGVCIDEATGGLRLSSTSTNTWTSKVVLTLYAMEEILKMEVPECVERELLGWAQVSAVDCTVSDQIRSDSRTAIGGHYYPRIVTAASWLW